MVVGHLDVVAGNGVGDSDGGLRDCLVLAVQVGADGVLQGGVVGGGDGVERGNARQQVLLGGAAEDFAGKAVPAGVGAA